MQQAKLVLQRIKADAPFEETTVYSRRQWQELLDWMSRLVTGGTNIFTNEQLTAQVAEQVIAT